MSRRIPDSEWLPLARALAVGQTSRHPHKGDRTTRPNLIVHNLPDRWKASCMSCGAWGSVMKTHVQYRGRRAPALSNDLSLPKDMIRLPMRQHYETDHVHAFILRKNMDASMLPPLWFSKERQRLLLETEHGWLGRDITELSPQKWLTYNRTPYLGRTRAGAVHFVVEDPFSFYKLRWATQEASPVCVPLCALGTKLHPALLASLAQTQMQGAVFFYDGDARGAQGAKECAARIRPYQRSLGACAPTGKDPKDMQRSEIIDHVRHSLWTLESLPQWQTDKGTDP